MKSLLKALHDMINYLFSSLLFGLLKKKLSCLSPCLIYSTFHNTTAFKLAFTTTTTGELPKVHLV